MRFGILGPLEVADGESSVSLVGAERALLALLRLSANEVVSTDRLIDAPWGEHAPRSGRTAAAEADRSGRQARRAHPNVGYVLIETNVPEFDVEIEIDAPW
jgi:DNA-binding response OmpR family regulator